MKQLKRRKIDRREWEMEYNRGNTTSQKGEKKENGHSGEIKERWKISRGVTKINREQINKFFCSPASFKLKIIMKNGMYPQK